MNWNRSWYATHCAPPRASLKYNFGKVIDPSCIPGNGWWKMFNKNKQIIVKNPKRIVVPMLKNVDEIIVGIINNIENGLEIPPVRYNSRLNCNKS